MDIDSEAVVVEILRIYNRDADQNRRIDIHPDHSAGITAVSY